MYRVVFKGDMEDMFLDNQEGRQLHDDLENNRLEGFINLKGSLVEVKSIKAILPNSSDPDSKESKEKGNEHIYNQNLEFDMWRAKRLSMSPFARAQDTSFFNFLCRTIRGRPLTEEEIPEVRVAQEQWFTDHPDFHNANPICYFKKEELTIPNEPKGMTPMKDLLLQNALDFAYRHLTI